MSFRKLVSAISMTVFLAVISLLVWLGLYNAVQGIEGELATNVTHYTLYALANVAVLRAIFETWR